MVEGRYDVMTSANVVVHVQCRKWSLQMHSGQDSISLGSVSVSFVIYGIIHFIIVGKVSFLARQDMHMQMGD